MGFLPFKKQALENITLMKIKLKADVVVVCKEQTVIKSWQLFPIRHLECKSRNPGKGGKGGSG